MSPLLLLMLMAKWNLRNGMVGGVMKAVMVVPGMAVPGVIVPDVIIAVVAVAAVVVAHVEVIVEY